MKSKKDLAIELRRLKKSYNEISVELSVSKGTLSGWFKDEEWSECIRIELNRKIQEGSKERIAALAKINKKRWEAWREEFRVEARYEYPTLKHNLLFSSGLCLYWGEGDSVVSNGMVRLANRDPRMLIVFRRFLQEICSVSIEKIKLWLLLYPDNDEEECKRYWSRTVGIPITQFQKTQRIDGKHPNNRLKYGMCTIYLSSRGLKEKMKVWIDLLSGDLIK